MPPARERDGRSLGPGGQLPCRPGRAGAAEYDRPQVEALSETVFPALIREARKELLP
ncbi:hypothetical protein GCM10018781_31940 [Kitasatospora indigofera]|uniref:Uncharacterized protein n=1 Tax=Kitasatospora indigofera TaxID=67307 RepID=A0A919FTG3_9ACTN|nr:hypothetical protein GCM10018781_31940 [Kitasatospora indigofera]